MLKGSIIYFDSPGNQNTDQVLDAVAERVRTGGIQHVVVASGSGETAVKAVAKLRDMGVRIVVVTEHCGMTEEGECEMPSDMEENLAKAGAKVVRATHVLSGIERGINRRIGGSSRTEAIAEALRTLFGHGMKVCVEISIMAADNGAIPCGEVEVIAVAGTESGADTACVVRPAHANGFFNFEVREVLAIPRIHRIRERK